MKDKKVLCNRHIFETLCAATQHIHCTQFQRIYLTLFRRQSHMLILEMVSFPFQSTYLSILTHNYVYLQRTDDTHTKKYD